MWFGWLALHLVLDSCNLCSADLNLYAWMFDLGFCVALGLRLFLLVVGLGLCVLVFERMVLDCMLFW